MDDHSGDGSFEIIRDFHKRDCRIRGCRLSENRGQQNALYCGLKSSTGNLIVTMDDDGQHPVSRLPDLLYLVEKDLDVVYLVNRDPRRRKILRCGTALTDLFFRLFCGKPSRVEIGSYRIMRRQVVENFTELPGRFVYISAMIFRSRPTPRVLSMHYTPLESQGMRKSRFSISGRMKVFMLLFLHYGPLRGLLRIINHRQDSPYQIEEIL